MKAIENNLIKETNTPGLTLLTSSSSSNGVNTRRMEHSTCFAAGLFALSSYYAPIGMTEKEANLFKKFALDLGNTCHESYRRTKSHLAPESFIFAPNGEFRAVNATHSLEPQTLESYFYLWRTTGDEKYRSWAWEIATAIEDHCRTNKGYAGLRDVDDLKAGHENQQKSYFLAETLKYLYLIFSDSDLLPLDQFVFNTAAHPILIKQ
jgi:mannosyl-oligosaccharide alpha-1,2-mannosidase